MKKIKLKPYVCPQCKERVTNEQMENKEGCRIVGGTYKDLKDGQRFHRDCYDRIIAWLFRG